jgi:hypothetical protein
LSMPSITRLISSTVNSQSAGVWRSGCFASDLFMVVAVFIFVVFWGEVF